MSLRASRLLNSLLGATLSILAIVSASSEVQAQQTISLDSPEQLKLVNVNRSALR